MSFEIEIYHIKILDRLNKNNGELSYTKMCIYFDGKLHYIKRIYKYISELEDNNAIIIIGKLFKITEKGKLLLDRYSNLLEISKRKKIRKEHAYPTSNEQKKLFSLIKEYINKKEFEKLDAIYLATQTGVGRQEISRKMSHLKKKGYIAFEPRLYNTIKILKEIE
ncbi:MAG: hypothetical protein OEZ01_04645 [Candidatus Heimdallarchaeota archaeon]|nr:hypothetical protein [Candidatus Heimdallarchaeota archaeon]